MKYSKFFVTAIMSLLGMSSATAQGWPDNYGGVMLQGFYWDSYSDTKWTALEKQADELSRYFSLIWVPQSGNCSGTSMGYNPKYYFDQNSSFGSETALRSMIKTFKAAGLGTIADVVINHRQNLSNWVDFPAETYNGVTYQMVSTDICADDDGGAAKTWADQNGYQLSSNNDSGEGWSGMRDLDHASANVQKCILAYEDFLLNDLGYSGFRYDVAKGFAAKYFALYNSTVKPQFSVGEVWDSNTTIQNWINGTKTDGTNTFSEPQSAAFDFQFRYEIRDAINNSNWAKVAGTNSLVCNSNYRRYAVTFVENHDTEKRATDAQDPIKQDTLAANALIIAMPGTPCVFLKHWQAYKKEIKLMIEARKLAGITNTSDYTTDVAGLKCAAMIVKGSNTNLIVAVGPNASTYSCSGYKELLSGYHYRYFVPNDFDTSGWNAVVERVNSEVSADTDDSQDFNAPSCCVVDAGETCAFFEAPSTWTSTIKCWCWGTVNYTGGSWPGQACTEVGTNNGNKVYKWTYTGTASMAATGIIFSNNGTPQTSDLDFKNGGYYTYDGFQGVVSSSSGINAQETMSADRQMPAYNLLGISVSPSYKGIVVRNGKKYINR